MTTHKKSFTLIEVLIFVTILSLFFVAAAAVTIVSLRNLKVQEHKILATRYAEELLELAKREKRS
jgi:prepilin-type N-terminal cleavage/methylation domain